MIKQIEYNIGKADIEIIGLADIHYGSPNCDIEYFEDVVEYIKENDNVFFFINGDLIENSTKTSPGTPFNDVLSPINQIVMVSEKLGPIAHKCINIVPGNHEDRTDKDVGINPMEMIVANLSRHDPSIIDRYCPFGAFSYITLGNIRKGSNASVCITMYNIHGTGAGTKYSTAVQKLDDMRNIVPAHIYYRSHTHKADVHPGSVYITDLHQHLIKEEPCIFCSNGAMLKYDGYAQKAQMTPISNDIPVIHVKAKRFQVMENKKRKDCLTKEIYAVNRNKDFFREKLNENKGKRSKL